MKGSSFPGLRKFLAPEFTFGEGARFMVGRYAKNLGLRKVLVVTDPGVSQVGWTREVVECLEEEDLPCTVFESVTPNPRDTEVMAGADVFQSQGCNGIVALGGGSPMDCAKGIGIVSSNHKHVLEFAGVDMVAIPAPPLICIPTTSGSSADVSQFAIIADQVNRVKVAIISKTVVPDVALIDPQTLATMSPFLIACTGIDAMVHAIEAYVSNAHSPITDLHALEAIRLVCSTLAGVVNGENDTPEGLYNLMLGSLQAGLAFSNASLGAVHALSHSLGGYLDLPHGLCNAILLPFVVDFNYVSVSERYDRIGQIIGLQMDNLTPAQRRQAMVQRLSNFGLSVGVHQSLQSLGIQRSDIPELAAKAFKDPCSVTNPRRPSRSDFEAIYAEAY